MTIIYNPRSNFVTGEISFITMSFVAILQLGVLWIIWIFLYHSYVEHKVLYPDKKEAMAHANCRDYHFCRRFFSDNHSRFPRNVCFMTFTLGLDMGIVMAKGVLFGVVGCILQFFLLLILYFDRAIEKSHHRTV